MNKAEAVALLKQEACTLLLYNEEEVIRSHERGVAPLLSLLDSGKDVRAMRAVDKVVGRAAAFLYVELGIAELHAVTISDSALEILSACSISVSYEVLVPRILNRAGDGYCPMESAVLCVTEVAAAIKKIRETRKALSENKNIS